MVADEEMGQKWKKPWVEEVGEKKMAAVFHTVMIVKVEQVGFLCRFPP